MPDSPLLHRVDILGVPITPFRSYEQVAVCIADRIQAGDKTFCVAINPEKIYRAQQNADLMTQLNAAQMHICDGIGAAVAARILHGIRVSRITGVALFMHLMRAAATNGWKVYLLGASPESNEDACSALRKRYPNLQIVGNRDGYFPNSDQVIDEINESGAEMLFVALGSPKQEQWIVENRDRLRPLFLMGIGGSLDVVSGRVKWAPKLFRNTGTEWLYRLICQPSRIRRQLVLPPFAWKVILKRMTKCEIPLGE